jgi:hypothetical protein
VCFIFVCERAFLDFLVREFEKVQRLRVGGGRGDKRGVIVKIKLIRV